MNGRFSEELDAFMDQMIRDPIMIAMAMAADPNRPTVAEVQAELQKAQKADKNSKPSEG